MAPAPSTVTTATGAPAPAAGAATATPATKEAATQLAGIFMDYLVQEMFASVGADDADGASQTYMQVAQEKLGGYLADSGGMGLAAVIQQGLTQEGVR